MVGEARMLSGAERRGNELEWKSYKLMCLINNELGVSRRLKAVTKDSRSGGAARHERVLCDTAAAATGLARERRKIYGRPPAEINSAAS